eukprot:CAMPEP_0114284250 /NCGR_PEP_ID=MMETSP0059-20121206/4550_1 /TAXON_ID=36894 /ORGANISM="Pyramimonas parkeae, Strain CCMP726" /LENGTH=369 /DNA_ID=CAMNT_0001405063 /DNA_START=258 /DNA_END=1364 /DNA_ORIENTATION=+
MCKLCKSSRGAQKVQHPPQKQQPSQQRPERKPPSGGSGPPADQKREGVRLMHIPAPGHPENSNPANNQWSASPPSYMHDAARPPLVPPQLHHWEPAAGGHSHVLPPASVPQPAGQHIHPPHTQMGWPAGMPMQQGGAWMPPHHMVPGYPQGMQGMPPNPPMPTIPPPHSQTTEPSSQMQNRGGGAPMSQSDNPHPPNFAPPYHPGSAVGPPSSNAPHFDPEHPNQMMYYPPAMLANGMPDPSYLHPPLPQYAVPHGQPDAPPGMFVPMDARGLMAHYPPAPPAELPQTLPDSEPTGKPQPPLTGYAAAAGLHSGDPPTKSSADPPLPTAKAAGAPVPYTPKPYQPPPPPQPTGSASNSSAVVHPSPPVA